jgi:Kef-type K+ transport system membrane component KefB
MYWIARIGAKQEIESEIIIPAANKPQWLEFIETLQGNIGHPLAILLAQIVTIILIARLFGWICKKIGQPTVVGEIAAGIFLGPSLIGMYFPEFSDALFPAHSLGNLQFLSQIGLVLFMFIVGMEIDIKLLKTKTHDAVVVSHASIIVPFALGMGLAYFLYHSFAPKEIPFSSFGLFIGIAMSITAFPVLARIVQERGIHKTRLGTVIITSAAVDDITAWSLLAAVIALVKSGSFVSSLYIILLAVIYVFLMIKFVRPFLKRVGDLHSSRETLGKPVVAIFILTLILSAWATEIIGIHALFGAFMAGTIMPDNPKFRNIFIEKIEDIALVLLLPLFFVYTGLRTEIGLLNGPYLWKITGLVIMVAIAGKFIGSTIAAKFVGQSWKDSLSIGALMNTRGLVELVVLNIGYDLGVLTPEIFAMLVIMALVTTFLTGPALDLINWAFSSKSDEVIQKLSQISQFKILVSFGKPESGKSLIRLASNFTKEPNENTSITAMHLIPSDNIHHYNLEEYENNCFAPIIEESQNLNCKITTLFKVTNDLDSDITEFANKGEYDLLLIGIGHSIYEGSLLGRIFGFSTRMVDPDRLINQVTGKEKIFENSPFDERTRLIISKSTVPVGILIDKGFSKTDTICIPIISQNDAYLMGFVQKLINYSGSQISFIDMTNHIQKHLEIKEFIRAIEQIAPNHVNMIKEHELTVDFFKQQDLMLISSESWRSIIETKSKWLADIPSTLIIAEKT